MKKLMLITLLMVSMISFSQQTDTTENVYYRGDMIIATGITTATIGVGTLLFANTVGRALIITGSITTIVGVIIKRRDGKKRRRSNI